MKQLRVLCLLALLGAGPGVGADEFVKDRASQCGLRVPAEWTAYRVHWTGACRAHTAHGLGAIRVFKGDKLQAAFYGRLADGRMRTGVIDTGEGYIAGEFLDGELLPSDDRNVVLRAFRTGRDAARAVSERFGAAGNAPSARYYAAVAEKLDRQMD